LTLISDYQKLMGMNPATGIIRKPGGEARVADITGNGVDGAVPVAARQIQGGTGRLIPQAHHGTLLDYARAHGIQLTAEEFLIPRGRALSGAG